MAKKLIMIGIFIVALILFTTLSVGVFEYKDYDPKTKTVSIRDTFFGDMMDITLLYNSYKCEDLCKADMIFKPYRTYSMKKTDDFVFFLSESGENALTNKYEDVEEYWFEIEEEVEREKPVYEEVCSPDLDSKNNSVICEARQTGFKTERYKQNKRIDLEKIVFEPPNEYKITLYAKKRRGVNIEWIPTFLGYEIKEWADWNVSSFPYCRNLNQERTNTTGLHLGIGRQDISGIGYTINTSTSRVRTVACEVAGGGYVAFDLEGNDIVYPFNISAESLVVNYSLEYGCTDCVTSPLDEMSISTTDNDSTITGADYEVFLLRGALRDWIDDKGDGNDWIGTNAEEGGSAGKKGLGSIQGQGAELYGETLHIDNRTEVYNGNVHIQIIFNESNKETKYIWDFYPYYMEATLIWQEGFTFDSPFNYTVKTFTGVAAQYLWSAYDNTEDTGKAIGTVTHLSNTIFMGNATRELAVVWNNSDGYIKKSYGTNDVVMVGYDGAAGGNWYKFGENITKFRYGILDTTNSTITGGRNFSFAFEDTVTITLGDEQDVGAAPNIALNSPENITYISQNVSLNFTVTDDSDAYLDCYEIIDGAMETSLGAIANGSYYNRTIGSLVHSGHTLTIRCVDGVDVLNGTNTTKFTTLWYNVSAESYDANAYETQTKKFTLNITTIVNVTDVDFNFFYDGKNWGSDLEGNESYTWFGEFNHTLPLVTNNNTPAIFQWNITLHYNGTMTNDTSTANTQTTLLPFYVKTNGQALSKVLVTEGGFFNITLSTAKILTPRNITINAYTLFNGSNYTAILSLNLTSSNTYEIGIVTPSIAGEVSKTFNVISYLNISFLQSQKLRSSETDTITIMELSLGNCSTHNMTAYNFTYRTEENKSAVNLTSKVAFHYWNDTSVVHSFSQEFPLDEQFSICFDPASAQFTVNATIDYGSSDYPHRNYYLVKSGTDNVSNEIYLYGIDDSKDTRVDFTIEDDYGIAEVDVIVKIQKYFIEDDVFVTIAMGRTNFEGKTSIPLNLYDTFYRFILERDGLVLRIFEKTKVNSNELTLKTEVDRPIEMFKYHGSVVSSCTTDNSTGDTIFTCTVDDTSGNALEVCMIVKRMGVTYNNTVYDSCSEPSSAVTHEVNLGDVTDYLYAYTLFAEFEDSKDVFEAGVLDYINVSTIYGIAGFFSVAIIILILSGVGAYNPSAAIILCIFGVIMGAALGLAVVSIASIFGLIIAGGILIFRMRK